ncbi:MAG: M56 family metallopeptidase [Agathobacter sp.]|nr:M56 family metallopeptidase [Agathobacter sp.]
MLNWIITSSLLILIVIALRFVLKGKISLRLQYGLWLLVLIRLLYPFSFGETAMSIGNWLDSAADTVEGQQMEEFVQAPLPNMSYEEAFDSVADKYYEQGIDINQIPEADLSETIEDEVLDTMRGGYTPEEILQMIWIAGMVVLGLWFVATNLQFFWKLKKSRVYLGVVGEVLEDTGLGFKSPYVANIIPVYQTEVVETPCLYGWIEPSVYVTKEVMDNKACLRHVLEHESTHYRHYDFLWSTVRVICLILHWYNPLVWCAAFLSRNDAELACDEATIERLGETERAAYGRTLIGLTCEKRPAVLITATTMTGSGKSIKERIALIAKKPKMAVITIVLLVFIFQAVIAWTFTGAKQEYASFSEWADTINSAQFQHFRINKGLAPTELYYYPTQEEFGKLCELLRAIPEEDCYRRKQTVGEYEEYHLYFLSGGDEVILKCLEDGTVLYGGSTKMPKFAPGGKSLIIDSPELWHYIVDTVNEKGKVPITESDQSAQKKYEQCIYETTADLNHDGYDDLVKVMTVAEEGRAVLDVAHNGAYIKVFTGNKDKMYDSEPVYTSDVAASSHSENGTFVLSEKDGKDYLVYSKMYEMWGLADYAYSVMCLENTEMVVVQSDKVSFCCDPFRWEYWQEGQRREDVVPQFKAGFEPWIENAMILVSYDVSTPDYIISEEEETPANTYYDYVWARNEDDQVKEFYDAVDMEYSQVGIEKWELTLYWEYFSNYDVVKGWFETQLSSDYSQWYTEYDGSKLQRIDNCTHGPNAIGCGVPASCDVIFYRAGVGEDESDALYKMIEKMIQARMVESDYRSYVITDYAIPEQELVPISEDMWLITFLKGYYAYEGSDLVTMQEAIDVGEPVTEDGLISFIAQGSPGNFYHILIEKDGVYRLERLGNMIDWQSID